VLVGTFRSALCLGCGGRSGDQLLGLVVVAGGNLTKLRLVGSAVVGAEEELATRGQRHSDVGLGATAVATVGGRQRRVRGKSGSHVALSMSVVIYRSSG
jgi:hypothetical protein